MSILLWITIERKYKIKCLKFILFFTNGRQKLTTKGLRDNNSFTTRNNVVISILLCVPELWSSPSKGGFRPPPCSLFSLTMTGEDQAMMFGGYTPPSGQSSEARVLHLPTMVSHLC